MVHVLEGRLAVVHGERFPCDEGPVTAGRAGAPARGPRTTIRRAVAIANNYATQAYTTTLGGAAIFIDAGARRDSVTDATLIATWASNWTTTAPVAGVGNVTGVLSGYLASYPAGP